MYIEMTKNELYNFIEECGYSKNVIDYIENEIIENLERGYDRSSVSVEAKYSKGFSQDCLTIWVINPYGKCNGEILNLSNPEYGLQKEVNQKREYYISFFEKVKEIKIII